jgi:RNA polymerase sigma-70 factor (ECF subfamily)
MTCTEASDEIPTHIPHLIIRARRLCRNEADARDLIQDTCLNALEALERAAVPPDNVRAWLVVIMKNLWLSTLRQHRVRAHAHAEIVNQSTVDARLHESRLSCTQLARAWSQLPAHSQNIARQCLLEGDSQEEVSRRLGMTAGGVAASIHRTREVLRQSMLEAIS